MSTPQSTINNQQFPIGYVIGGGLKESFRVRLTADPLEVQEGAFVVVESGPVLFYGLVTDLQLAAADPQYADEELASRLGPVLSKALADQTLYTVLEVLPALMLERGPEPGAPGYEAWLESLQDRTPRPRPVKTVPPHHASVRLAAEADIAEIFGKPGDGSNFVIGYTREQEHPVCVDLARLVQRSAGVFGATGTGKSFLTRIVMAGLVQSGQASVLVLDMHNEYGFDGADSDTGGNVPGLRTKFPAKVRVVGLGGGAAIRGTPPDFNLEIAMSDISTADIEMLTTELNLKETTPTTLDALYTSFRTDWFREFRALKYEGVIEDPEAHKKVPAPGTVEYWANSAGVNGLAAKALYSKLGRLFKKPYIVEKPAADSVGEITAALERGQHIVLSFGEFETDLDYLLVSNLLTRKLREAWVHKTDKFRKDGKGEPRQLVIVLEEAHKLLSREMAGQTTFSTIARELRKYYVTLLVVDQRPSQIYDEVMSQLGTRISGWLGDEDDIHAVLSGLAGREALRGMLARLQPKEEVLLLGWGVPMPLPIKSRRYDDAFWKELLGSKRRKGAGVKDLGFS
jgi:DNA helicase HerA-like ATPase